MPKAKNPLHKLHQRTVEKFCWKSNISWPREIKLAQKIIRNIDEEEFWDWIKVDGPFLPSLAWFLTFKGAKYLNDKRAQFEIQKKVKKLEIPSQKRYDIQDQKVGEDKQVPSKPQTLMEFIKHGEANKKAN